MNRSTPYGITPPAPGLDREEPEFRGEADIPSEDSSHRDRGSERGSSDRPSAGGERGKPERE